MVNITIRVLTKPVREDLPKCYDFLGTDKDMDHRVLPSIVPEVLKAVVAKYNASALVTKREEISLEVRGNLEERLRETFHMTLEDVSLTNIAFGPEYSAAVERKQIAQQEAERAKYKVQQAEQEKRSIVVRAQGEAEAARKINEAMQNNPGFLELRRIEKAREIAQLVSKSPNRYETIARPLPSLENSTFLQRLLPKAALSLVLGWYLLRLRRALFVRAACISTPTC